MRIFSSYLMQFDVCRLDLAWYKSERLKDYEILIMAIHMTQFPDLPVVIGEKCKSVTCGLAYLVHILLHGAYLFLDSLV